MRRGRPKGEVPEDLLDHLRVFNEREDAHGARTPRTNKRVRFVHLLDQPRPCALHGRGGDLAELGATPNEVYFGRHPANRAPRFEPRPRWPHGSPCTKPQTLVEGKTGTRLELAVTFQDGRKHLPIVTLRRVA